MQEWEKEEIRWRLERENKVSGILVAEAEEHLYACEFEDGWKKYESRSSTKRPGVNKRLYEGIGSCTGTLWIWREMGLGDEIMFASIIGDVAQNHPIVLETQPRLVTIFKRSFAQYSSVEVVPYSQPANEQLIENELISNTCAIGSLPRVFRPTLESFSGKSDEYLIPDIQAVKDCIAKYDTDTSKLIVGLAWRGGSTPDRVERRSIEIEELSPLLDLPNIRYVSLQHGIKENELQYLSDRYQDNFVIDTEIDPYGDVDGLASQIMSTDIVVTIDCTIAHLAGALGKTALLLLDTASNWRWLRTTKRSYWYSSLRLIRQGTAGDWASPINQVVDTLEELSKDGFERKQMSAKILETI